MKTIKLDEFKKEPLDFGGIRTNEELKKAWLAGETVFSVEMGGLGPSYEQTIQNTAFEIFCRYLGKPLPSKKGYEHWADDVFKEPDHNDHSGATGGAAKYLAYKFLSRGYCTAMREAQEQDSDRIIQVERGLVRE